MAGKAKKPMGDPSKSRIKSVWITRKESMYVSVNNEIVSRETSLGLSVESNDMSAKSVDLYAGADRALNLLFEEERDNYLNVDMALDVKRQYMNRAIELEKAEIEDHEKEEAIVEVTDDSGEERKPEREEKEESPRVKAATGDDW